MTTPLTRAETEHLLDGIRQADAGRQHYPPHLLAARRARFVAQIEARNDNGVLHARRQEILTVLHNDPFLDKATAYELLDELAEIETILQKG